MDQRWKNYVEGGHRDSPCKANSQMFLSTSLWNLLRLTTEPEVRGGSMSAMRVKMRKGAAKKLGISLLRGFLEPSTYYVHCQLT
jgi:hypothetical protein